MPSLWLVLYSLLVVTVSGYDTYYVAPSINTPCPGSPCKTLDDYIAKGTRYFTNNTSFSFLPGTHVLSKSTAINSATNITLEAYSKTVTIKCNGSGGIIFQNCFDVELSKLLFDSCGQPLPPSLQRDGETAQAALAFGQVTHLLLDSVTVSHSKGYGLLAHCVHGNLTVTNSAFSHNKGSAQYLGGNAAIEYTNCSAHDTAANVLLSSSQFSYGGYDNYSYTNYTGTLATGLMMILSQKNNQVLITNVTMDSNVNCLHNKCFGGNFFIHLYNETGAVRLNINITNSKFTNGTSWLGGGLGITYFIASSKNTTTKCGSNIAILNTEVSYNRGIVGGGMYFEFLLKAHSQSCPYVDVTTTNTTFNGNFLDSTNHSHLFGNFGNGAAVHLVAAYAKSSNVKKVDSYSHYTVDFKECTFKNNWLKVEKTLNSFTKLALAAMVIVSINTDLSLSNCNITDNDFTGLGLYNSKLTASGSITIQNNTGLKGGGILLCQSSLIALNSHTTVSLISNHAVQSGGGIFVETGCTNSKPFCFYQSNITNGTGCSEIFKTAQIVMLNNTAGYAGEHIYGGHVDNCKIRHCNSLDQYHNLFHITPNNTGGALSAVTSAPAKICFCDENSRPNCAQGHRMSSPKYPGELITVSVAVVGQLNGTVPGTVLVSTRHSNTKPSPVTIGKNCKEIHVQVLDVNNSNHTAIVLQLSSNLISELNNMAYVSISEPREVRVPLKPCPAGFDIKNSVCDCNEWLAHNSVICITSNQTIVRNPPAWIGYGDTDGGMIFHHNCPYDYCVKRPVNLTPNDTTIDQDIQCAGNRAGVLCSKCRSGYSLSSGTSNCLHCKQKVIIPVFIAIGHALAGVVLILLLIIFNITYSDGMFSGILFYGNTININGSTFLSHQQVSRTFIVLISWMSLNLGIDTCFYDGMDSYAKAWLGFCFPLYLFLINALLIILCRVSTKLASILGRNIIKVLATLFQLSYTSLIQSVVIVLSPTVLHYSNGPSKTVWLYDPSLRYFSGKHIPLTLVAIVFGLLILAYTLVLLFVQPLQRYSHLPCFSWMAKLKPLIDAYTAPHVIKDNCRYWEGLLLLFRFVMAIMFAANTHSRINTSLAVISSSCVILMTIAWCAGGIYKKTQLNILNSLYIVNLLAVAIAVSYDNPINAEKTVQIQRYTIAVNISYSLAIATLLIVLIYLVLLQGRRWYMAYKKRGYQALPQDNEFDNNRLPPLHQF